MKKTVILEKRTNLLACKNIGEWPSGPIPIGNRLLPTIVNFKLPIVVEKYNLCL